MTELQDEGGDEDDAPRGLTTGDVVAKRYEIREVLGEGGMGVVYSARHVLSGRKVALKWVDSTSAVIHGLLERFVRETQAMGRIEHPNVVGVLDAGIEQDAAYLTMELLRGESLRDVIDRDAPLDPAEAIALLMPGMQGVEAAHRARVIHRDLKPENLFVVRQADGSFETTKVLDFGISKLTERPVGSVSTVTQAGSIMGTPHYMSPEQARGAAVDLRVDVWALGVILYELIAGDPPFDRDNYGALMIALATEPHTPLCEARPGVDPDLSDIIDAALEKRPEDRWESVAAMARALERHTTVAFEEPIRRASDFPPSIEAAPIEPPADTSSIASAKTELGYSSGRVTLPSRPAALAAPTEAKPSGGWKLLVGVAVIGLLVGIGWLVASPGSPDAPEPVRPAGERATPGADDLEVESPPVASAPTRADAGRDEALEDEPPPVAVAPAPADPPAARPAPRRRRARPPSPTEPASIDEDVARGRSGTLSREEFF
ncbi:MAG: serine/threonine protein kinase [Sandaracinaceae bacterium]|nr:serine/threonine protein kinase [Sandaracinaceae bacterium]